MPGGVFPDYELPDHTSTPRRLSELQGDDPLILTLARGHYCPKEHQQHLELAAFYPKIAVSYTQVATISTDGNGTVREPRMYQLIRQPKPISDQQFEIEFLDAGVEVFSFTFG